MGDLTIRIRDANRQPLDDLVDVGVFARDGAVIGEIRGKSGKLAHKFTGLEPLMTYVVRVYPLRHRPVQKFFGLAGKSAGSLEFYCPVLPDRAKAEFPAYEEVHPTAHEILERSEVESYPGARGVDIYRQLPDEEKAGLLNLVAKMAATKLDGNTTTLDQVEMTYRLRGDRLFANVKIGMREKVIGANQGTTFRLVSGSLCMIPAPPSRRSTRTRRSTGRETCRSHSSRASRCRCGTVRTSTSTPRGSSTSSTSSSTRSRTAGRIPTTSTRS